MNTRDIYALSDIAALAQAEIQATVPGIDPIIGINRSLRKAGFPIDMMTIDCLKTGKRITFLVSDEKPGLVDFQFGFKKEDPKPGFTSLPFEKVTKSQFCLWIDGYFK